MNNDALWWSIQDLNANKIRGRDAKNDLRQRRRGAFNSFFNSVCSGNAHFGRAVLRHGFSTPREFQMLLQEFYEYTTSEKYRQEQANKKRDKKKRAVAFAARKRVRDARSLQRKLDEGRLQEMDLGAAQRELLQLYSTGDLERERNEANKAYGFGGGVEDGLSIEQIITIGSTTRALDSYFAS